MDKVIKVKSDFTGAFPNINTVLSVKISFQEAVALVVS